LNEYLENDFHINEKSICIDVNPKISVIRENTIFIKRDAHVAHPQPKNRGYTTGNN